MKGIFIAPGPTVGVTAVALFGHPLTLASLATAPSSGR